MTLRDLSNKDVIQLKTGENLGRIDDIVFVPEVGKLYYGRIGHPARAGALLWPAGLR